MKFFLPLLVLVIAPFLQAQSSPERLSPVVRPAPDFQWESFNDGSKALRSLKQQPVVLIVARSARTGAFRKQLREVERLYRQFAGRETLFVAAFTEESGVVKSDIPFLIARDPQGIAANYGFSGSPFGIAVIGPDFNIDLASYKVTSGERLRDIIDNSYPRQSIRR